MDDGTVEQWGRPMAWGYSLLSGDPPSQRSVVALAELNGDEVVLDVGCGPGAAVRRASRRAGRAVGVDPSPAMVDIARRRSRGHPQASFEVGHAADLPFDDDTFTVVWTISSQHHWPDRAAGLAEVARVLAPGGRLLVAEKRLRRPGGHGLASDEADDLAAQLAELGFDGPAVSEHRPRFQRMLLVSATAASS